MKVVALADTHTYHHEVAVPDGDLLIYAGDACLGGSIDELASFVEWLKILPHRHKVMIAGNHDGCLEIPEGRNPDDEETVRELMTGITYLEDSSCEIDGVSIYGSPYTPKFGNWAFMLNAGFEIGRKWRIIPENTDILVTHGPPLGFLDRCPTGPVGCLYLREAVARVQPTYHIFGHIHEGYGTDIYGGTTLLNVSVCDGRYDPCNEPMVFDV